MAGPRQVGKTTLVRKALEPFGELARYVTAAEPTLRDREWIAQQWDAARQVIASFHLRKKGFSQVSVVGVDSRGCRPHALRAYDDQRPRARRRHICGPNQNIKVGQVELSFPRGPHVRHSAVLGASIVPIQQRGEGP